jgi:plastocyanin
VGRQAQVQVRRDLAANWTTVNPVLLAGEVGFETDTLKVKVGTGVAWNSTSYAAVGTADNATKWAGRGLFVASTAPSTGMASGDIWIKI